LSQTFEETEINIIETTDFEGNSNARVHFGDDSVIAELIISKFRESPAVKVTIEIEGLPAIISYGSLISYDEIPMDTEEPENFIDIEDESGSLVTLLEEVEGEICSLVFEETQPDL